MEYSQHRPRNPKQKAPFSARRNGAHYGHGPSACARIVPVVLAVCTGREPGPLTLQTSAGLLLPSLARGGGYGNSNQCRPRREPIHRTDSRITPTSSPTHLAQRTWAVTSTV